MTIRQTVRDEALHCALGISVPLSSPRVGCRPLPPLPRIAQPAPNASRRPLGLGSCWASAIASAACSTSCASPAGRSAAYSDIAGSAAHPRHGALAALGAHTHPASMMIVTEAKPPRSVPLSSSAASDRPLSSCAGRSPDQHRASPGMRQDHRRRKLLPVPPSSVRRLQMCRYDV